VPHSIECERLVRDRLELWRRKYALSICARGHFRGLKPQAERRVAGRTHLAARPITVEAGGEFVAPGCGISVLRKGFGGRMGCCAGISSQIQIRTLHSNRLPDFRLRLKSGNRRRTRGRLAVGPPLQQRRGKGLQGTTANFSTQRTIHESQSLEIVPVKSYQFALSVQPQAMQRES